MDASSHCNETTAMSINTHCVTATPSPSHCQAHSAPRRDVNRPHLSDFRLCRMYSLATAGAFHPADQTMHPQHRRWPEMSHNPRPPAAGQTCNSGQTWYSGQIGNSGHQSPPALSHAPALPKPFQQQRYIHYRQTTALSQHVPECWQSMAHQAGYLWC